MDTVLLKLETAETLRASGSDTGVEVTVHNLGAAGERDIVVEIEKLGLRSEKKIHMERDEEISLKVPLDLDSVKEPCTASLKVSSPCRMPAQTSRVFTFLPRDCCDVMSETLATDMMDMLPPQKSSVHGKSLGADSMEAYYALKDMNLLPDDPGRYVHITDPQAAKMYGDGTPLEIALVYLSDMVSRGYSGFLLILGGHALAGVTEGAPDRDIGHLTERFIVVEPSASCNGVPLAVSKDLSKALINRYEGMITPGKNLAFRSSDDAE